MTPEPSDEYQKLVEAVARAIVAADDEALLLRDGYPKRAAENFARAALSALSVSETAGRAQLKLPHADDAADPSSSEIAAQPQPALPHAGDVTQADRDAAADLIELYWRRGCGVDRQMQNLADSIRAGHSAGPFPAAFARYRKAILSEAATMTDYDAAREVAFELGVPDIQGPRQQEILARAFASHREKAKTETLEPQSVSTDHVMGPSRLNHGNAQCINCLATDLELRVLGPVCPAAKAKGTPHV